ncbi:hypothetical protein V1522DRAFT_218049 [Lipomyces starkeyi]
MVLILKTQIFFKHDICSTMIPNANLTINTLVRPNERMTTPCKRLDYRALNDGSDDEAAPEDRVARSTMPGPVPSSQSAIGSFIKLHDC